VKIEKKTVKIAGISWIFAKNVERLVKTIRNGDSPRSWTIGPCFFFFEVGKVRDGWLLVGGFKHGFYFPFFISDME
jgi:hypothetical protein